MLVLLIVLVLALLALLSITLQKVYTHTSLKELKRRARAGDEPYKTLYKAAAYGDSLHVMLWFFIGIFSVGFFIILARNTSIWLAALGSLGLFWLGFAWLPHTSVNSVGLFLARWLTPPLGWLLAHAQPLLSRLTHFVNPRADSHTGMYEKEDIIELLKQQKKQTDNRISKEEIDIAINSLKFGEKLVREIMIPRRVVKTVNASEPVGPVLMDELHKNGHSRFPVYQDKPDNIVGTLYVKDLIDIKHGGQVKDIMKKDVYYVREDQPLGHALQAFLKTKHHLFIAVNNFEEMVGVITIEDVLEQVLGKPIMDEFDKYEDLRAVATFDAEKEEEKHTQEDKVIE